MKILEPHARNKPTQNNIEILKENHEHHGNLRIPLRITTIIKILKFHVSIMKIMKILELQTKLRKIKQ